MAIATKKIAIAIAAAILAIAAIWYALEIFFFNSISSSEAKTWLRISEVVLVVSAILLTLGLLGEWPDSEDWKKRTIYKLAKAAVIVGVLGELLGDGGIFEASDRLQEIEGKQIGEANTKAADAILKAARVEEAAAWRLLDQDRSAKLKAALSGKVPRKIVVGFAVGDPESISFAIQVLAAFSGTNWQVTAMGHWYESQLVPGVRVLGSDGEGQNLIKNALTDAEIPFETTAVPQPDMYNGASSAIDDEKKLFLYIGTKPSPKF